MSRTHKANGDVETYTYDSQNRLVGYASPTTTASYAYDALDRRIAKTVDGSTSSFIHESSAAEGPVHNNIHLEFLEQQLSHRWLHGHEVDDQIAFEAYTNTSLPGSGQAYDLYSDRLGSISLVVNSTAGTITTTADYGGFGDVVGSFGTSLQRYAYTGREFDSESGLLYYRARSYDPHTGKFLQSDPIGFVAGPLNISSYASNDPFNITDPIGLTGSIKRPNRSPGAAGADFGTLNAGLKAARPQAIRNIADGAMNAALRTMIQAQKSSLRALRREIHHKKPQYMGGGGGANAVALTRLRHVYVHKMMRLYMRPFVKNGRSLEAKRGNTGFNIRATFTKREMDVIVRQFYRDLDAVLGIKIP